MAIGIEALLLVGLGGSIGACLRYLVSGTVPLLKGLPTGTLLVNVIGSTILSTLTFLSEPYASFHLINIGILGSFTTFSTFAYESFKLLEEGRTALFVSNITLNLLLCLSGVYIGQQITSLI
ncbi:camphor resistance protein CrcB [Methanococcoides vulcani]|uniref:Fluoride-specific ion channel FluC n=1 Tax=Methanococcoides vulcani TaxID=1353158 RepID=A0A1H9Y4A6_9EURY|nr:fluoride efflux transporter CrcB [Methanococcoides vulcani]SES63595.1 camphor resistance protein CrcB [Methanococcoides vulcani]